MCLLHHNEHVIRGKKCNFEVTTFGLIPLSLTFNLFI